MLNNKTIILTKKRSLNLFKLIQYNFCKNHHIIIVLTNLRILSDTVSVICVTDNNFRFYNEMKYILQFIKLILDYIDFIYFNGPLFNKLYIKFIVV